ncbi:hypothetical protein [Rudaeicoccus suwonensis]|uniref:Uncharacterized protein n=1 Tax=Rudaeicoccus suwonensis TaxID=657409 RepID=A0A561E488_9MICO|nr:hypothetical protein [Rudaeicoccus suwonensis]TWE10428.1 hypothetical protein BKA23_2789 [Rudaeicoccus suwonensis]
MGLLSRLFDPDGSSRQLRASTVGQLREAAAAPLRPTEPDSPEELLQRTQALILEINSSAADLPGIGVVLARAVTDTVQAALTGPDATRIDINVRVAFNATLTDYLPGSIRAYVAAVRSAGRDGEAQATDALVEQLTTLRRSVEDLARAGRDRDMSALQVHGRFLEDKFSQSELNL